VPGSEVLLGVGKLRPPPGANTLSTVRGAPQGLGILNVLATEISTLRRVPIAAPSSCAGALTCLLQAVER